MPLSAECDKERSRRRYQTAPYQISQRQRREQCTNTSNSQQDSDPQIVPPTNLSDSILVQHDDDEDQWWHNFILSFRSRWHSPTWSRTCQYCGVLLLTGEDRTFCCNNGQTIVPLLPPLPPQITTLLTQPSSTHNPSSFLRRLNNLFSFMAIGASKGFTQFASGPASVSITGHTYHPMLDVQTPNLSLHWFLYDESETVRRGEQWDVPVQWVRAMKETLDDINPYVWNLHQFTDISRYTSTALELHNHTSANDFAAIMHAANSINIAPRSVVIWNNSSCEPSFISIFTPHYEALQYPLLFPHGTRGWGLVLSSAPDHHNHMINITGFEWYKGQILRKDRFLIFSRLCSEYLCNMYSRIEEERLEFIRRGRLTRAQELNESINLNNINIELPASFIGLRKWASEQTADSLALAREFGRPLYFITMACNPDWPEITNQLTRGQMASDVPVIVA